MADLSEPMTADLSQHSQELVERLDALKRNERFCDVKVVVKDKEFKAHRVVLAAASPFFLSLLESDMRESNEQVIRIELEEATASVMEDVLQYVYTGNVSVTEESSHNLIATADYLLLPGLKNLASGFLEERVTIENCVFNYYFADRYQCLELKDTCRATINSNFTAVMETDDFLSLELKQLMEWVSSDDINVSAEEEVFMGIVKWVSHNKSERGSCFPALLHQVRLSSISHDFLLKKLVKEELVAANSECVNHVLGSMESIFVPSCESVTKAPRNCLKMLVDGIFVCGGRKALCYLPDVNRWYRLVNMTLEHQNHAAIQYRDKVYVFSKQSVMSGHQLPVAEYYTPSTNYWGAIQTNFPGNVQFTSLSVLNGCSSLYALTNNYSVFGSKNTIFAYNPVENEWKVQGDETDRWGACGVTDGCHLYIIGGSDCYSFDSSVNATTKVERFDSSAVSLEEVAPLNEARHDAFGAAMNGKIYVAGGRQISAVLNSCEMYNPTTNEWHLMPSLSVPRHSASMVYFKEDLYVVGGLKNVDRHSNARELSIEKFNSETNEWKEKCAIPVSHEDKEETKKQIHYKACFAAIHKKVLENPINSKDKCKTLRAGQKRILRK